MSEAPLPTEVPGENSLGDNVHVLVPQPPPDGVTEAPVAPGGATGAPGPDGAAPTGARAPEDASHLRASPRITILGDVELRVEVVLGRARRTLQDLIEVRPGQTIELDRQRNSPVEVLVNDRPFALGEIVVIDETNLGVRVLEILDWSAGSTARLS